jgi:hypothetical protein
VSRAPIHIASHHALSHSFARLRPATNYSPTNQQSATAAIQQSLSASAAILLPESSLVAAGYLLRHHSCVARLHRPCAPALSQTVCRPTWMDPWSTALSLRSHQPNVNARSPRLRPTRCAPNGVAVASATTLLANIAMRTRARPRSKSVSVESCRYVYASIADLARLQLFEYDRLLTLPILATTSSRSDSARAHAKYRRA